MPNNTSAHVTTIVSWLTAILAAVHPGFTLPPTVQTVAVAAFGLIGGIAQLFHINLKKEWLKGYNAFQLLRTQIAADIAKLPAPVKDVVDSAATAAEKAITDVVTPPAASAPAAPGAPSA